MFWSGRFFFWKQSVLQENFLLICRIHLIASKVLGSWTSRGKVLEFHCWWKSNARKKKQKKPCFCGCRVSWHIETSTKWPIFGRWHFEMHFHERNILYFDWNFKKFERVVTAVTLDIGYMPGGRFKNTYELLNLRALKISMLYKNHIFQCMGKIFCVEFQRVPLKFHTKYLTHTLKDVDFIHIWKFKSF